MAGPEAVRALTTGGGLARPRERGHADQFPAFDQQTPRQSGCTKAILEEPRGARVPGEEEFRDDMAGVLDRLGPRSKSAVPP
jgi:hypothetical protein